MLDKAADEDLQLMLSQARDKLPRVAGCSGCQRRVREWIMTIKQEINRRIKCVL